MRSYIYDDLPGDQRLPHDSGILVGESELKALGVLYRSAFGHLAGAIDLYIGLT